MAKMIKNLPVKLYCRSRNIYGAVAAIWIVGEVRILQLIFLVC